jgi:hypothetical protein
MRKFYGLFAVSLLAFACNEVLGLTPGVRRDDQGGGGSVSAGSSGEGGSALGPGSGGTATGGAAATGGGARPPSGGTAGENTTGGGGDAGRAGSGAGTGGGSGGGAGSGGGNSCESTADCIEQGLPWPSHLCLSGACVDIVTEECDTVVGAEWLLTHPEAQPIVFGSITQRLDYDDPSLFSLRLAMREFTNHGPVPIDGARRPVLLLCQTPHLDSNFEPIERSLDHLIDNVGVSGMLMLATRQNLLGAVLYAQNKGADVFFLDFAGGNSELTFTYDQTGHVWHMLGDTNHVAAPFAPLVTLVEEHVNPGASTGQGARLTRLVLLPPDYDDAFESEIAVRLESSIHTNNRKSSEYPDTYRMIPVRGRFDLIPGEVAAFEPDIVIDFAGRESEIDAAMLARGASPPFYILPPSRVGSLLLQNQVQADPSLRTRIVGVNHAGPVDTALYDAYLARFTAASTDVDGRGSANVYDAVYFLVYAAVAGGTGGANMSAGMQRLLSPTGPQGNIGPTTIGSVLELLGSVERMSLYGALGPPYFDFYGGRDTRASVWCMNENLEYVTDVLRSESYDHLTGTFPCFDF